MTEQKDGGPALLPCPFCGEEPQSFPSGINDMGLMIQCFTLGCVNPHTSWIPPEVAVEKWNTRAMVSSRGEQ